MILGHLILLVPLKDLIFDVFKDKLLGNFNINSYGKHSILNALSVIAASYLEGLDINQVRKYLMTYEGAKEGLAKQLLTIL